MTVRTNLRLIWHHDLDGGVPELDYHRDLFDKVVNPMMTDHPSHTTHTVVSVLVEDAEDGMYHLWACTTAHDGPVHYGEIEMNPDELGEDLIECLLNDDLNHKER